MSRSQDTTGSSKSFSTNSTVDVGSPYTPRRPSPIVSISVNHPLAQAARKIKNFFTHKQTLFSTTFTIKVTPIVALVSLLGVGVVFGGGITTAFNFGKTVEQKFLALSPTPTPKVIIETPTLITTSKTGTIKTTYALPSLNPTAQPTSSLNDIEGSGSAEKPTPSPIPTPQPILHYILVSRSGSINYLAPSSSVYLQNYVNLKVVITGSFDSSKNTLHILKSSDIEVLE